MTAENATENGTAEKEKPKKAPLAATAEKQQSAQKQHETTMVLLTMVVFKQNYWKVQIKMQRLKRGE